jgi:hypothetical protein
VQERGVSDAGSAPITMDPLCYPSLGPMELLCPNIHAPLMAVVLLDRKSRRSVREFTIQFGIGCAVVLGPCIMGMRPWVGAAQLLALIFSLNGFIDFCRAMLNKEKMNESSLNLWDEAIAFTGCSYLLHAMIRYQS